MEYNFETKDYIASCSEDITNITMQIYDTEKSIEKIKSITGLKKLMHATEIAKRLKQLESNKAELKTELENLKRELSNYQENGIEYYLSGEGREDNFQVQRIKKRSNKLEIVMLIDLGLM